VNYQFPWVVLGHDAPVTAVCTIFEDLNKRGVRLSVFDLLVARFWPQGVTLRDLWEQARAIHEELDEFDIDPYYLLQVVTLLSTFEQGGTTASCKKSDVLALTGAAVRQWWDEAASAMQEAILRLADDCGVLTKKWLPYEPMLVPLAATLASERARRGRYPSGIDRERLNRWFWCSVFGQAYEQGATSQSAKDFVELVDWLGGGIEPSTVRAFNPEGVELESIGPKQTALYRGVIALILSGSPHPRDFRSFNPINRTIAKADADDHHIFPNAYLKQARPDLNEAERNVVLNRTLIDRETNQSIHKKAPSVYVAALPERVDTRTRSGLLKSHLIPGAPEGPLLADDYDEFLRQRKELIAGRVVAVTSGS